MTADTGRADAAIALDLLETAFADRAPPAVLTTSRQLSDIEYEEAMSYRGLRWQDLTFDHVERNADAVFWFAPEAFCYYLPGMLAAGLRENRCDTNAYDALIGMLDRSPAPEYWDDFFLPRWTLLSAAEIDAVAAWARWLEAVQPGAFHGNTYERVRTTLALLKDRRSGA